MKEAPKNYSGIVFQETFRNEQAVRKNGGIPYNVTFENGKGSFDGSSSYIDISQKFLLENNPSGSVRVRFNSSDFSQTTNSKYVLYSRNGTTDTRIYLVYVYSGNGVKAQIGSGTSSYVSVSEDTDYEAVITWADGIAKFYLNNELQDSFSYSISSGANSPKFYIGSGVSPSFNGTIDLFELYNRDLSAEEISNLYNNKWNKEQNFTGGNITNPYIADFSNDEDGWVGSNANVTGNVDDVSGENDCLKIWADGTNSYHLAHYGTFEKDKVYKVTCKLYVPSGQTNVTKASLSTGHGLDIISGNQLTTKNDEWEDMEIKICASNNFTFRVQLQASSSNFVGANSPDDDLCYVKDLVIQEVNPKTLLDFDSTNDVIEDRMIGNTVDNAIYTLENFSFLNSGTELNVVSTTQYSVTNVNIGGKAFAVLTPGRKYRLDIKASTTASSMQIRSYYSGSGINDSIIGTQSSVDGVYEFVSPTGKDGKLYFRNSDAGTLTVERINLYEIRDELDATDVEVTKEGALFNGSTSIIDTGLDFVETKPITVMGWIKPYSAGGGSQGRIIWNGKFGIAMYYNRVSVTSNSSNYVLTPTTGGHLFNYHNFSFIAVTRDVDGEVYVYYGDKDISPVLIKTGNSGTPVKGTANIHIGGNTSSSKFDGLIPKLKVVEGILDTDKITQHWSETRKEIK